VNRFTNSRPKSAFYLITAGHFRAHYTYTFTNISALTLLALGWASGRAHSLAKIELLSANLVVCLEQGANDLHITQLMPLPPLYLLLH